MEESAKESVEEEMSKKLLDKILDAAQPKTVCTCSFVKSSRGYPKEGYWICDTCNLWLREWNEDDERVRREEWNARRWTK
jgi:hypothetical protein